MAKTKSLAEERIFRNYISDALFFQGQNKTHAKRYKDLITLTPIQENAQKIIDEVAAKSGITIVKKEDADAGI